MGDEMGIEQMVGTPPLEVKVKSPHLTERARMWYAACAVPTVAAIALIVALNTPTRARTTEVVPQPVPEPPSKPTVVLESDKGGELSTPEGSTLGVGTPYPETPSPTKIAAQLQKEVAKIKATPEPAKLAVLNVVEKQPRTGLSSLVHKGTEKLIYGVRRLVGSSVSPDISRQPLSGLPERLVLRLNDVGCLFNKNVWLDPDGFSLEDQGAIQSAFPDAVDFITERLPRESYNESPETLRGFIIFRLNPGSKGQEKIREDARAACLPSKYTKDGIARIYLRDVSFYASRLSPGISPDKIIIVPLIEELINCYGVPDYDTTEESLVREAEASFWETSFSIVRRPPERVGKFMNNENVWVLTDGSWRFGTVGGGDKKKISVRLKRLGTDEYERTGLFPEDRVINFLGKEASLISSGKKGTVIGSHPNGNLYIEWQDSKERQWFDPNDDDLLLVEGDG